MQTRKVTFIGDVNTGKSSLAYRMKYSNSPSQNLPATVGGAFLKMNLGDYDLSMWDSSGQERFKSLVPLYLRGSDVVICVYDVNTPDTLNRVQSDIDMYTKEDFGLLNAVWIVVGNKIDLFPFEFVSAGKELADQLQYPFVYVSAKTGEGVSTLLNIMEDELKKKSAVLKIGAESFVDLSLFKIEKEEDNIGYFVGSYSCYVVIKKIKMDGDKDDEQSCVASAISMYNKGFEKMDVIRHILKCIFVANFAKNETVSGFSIVFREPHSEDKQKTFFHVLFQEDGGVHPPFEKESLLHDERLEMCLKRKINTHPLRKWSIKKLSSVVSSHALQFQVYEVLTKPAKVYLSEKHMNRHNLPKHRGSLHCTSSVSELNDACEVLEVLLKLYKYRNFEKGKNLKERIYNEIVQTMAVPLVVFDIRRSNSISNDLSKRMICTYYNNAFYTLTNGKAPILDAQHLMYADNNHQPFASFFATPKIHQAFESVMLKHPLHYESDRSTSGSLSSATDAGSDTDYSPGFTFNSSSPKKKVDDAVLTISVDYGDSIIPHSTYELHIYRVNGTRVGLIILDISEKVRQLALIEQASKAKTDFLANMNHEFRTPLNSIDGNLQLLSRTLPLTDNQKNLIHRMRLAETSLMSLLQEVLDYSKLEQRKMKLHNEAFSLRHCLEVTMEVMTTSALSRNVNLSYVIDIDVPPLIVGDSWRLQQIMVNLITNSINHTIDGKVQICVSRENCFLLFGVLDTGSGIPLQMQSTLFAAWSTQPSSNFKQSRGTGLGLAICKELCHLMGGSIWVHETSSKGTTMNFKIPLQLADDQDIQNLATKEITSLKEKQLLILHDDIQTKNTLFKPLLKWGLKPTFCCSLDEMRDYINADYEFDAILICGLCKEQSVVELAQFVSNKYPSIPLIGCSSGECTLDVTIFRKVMGEPILAEELFHILVNLFMSSDTNSVDIVGSAEKSIRTSSLQCLVAEDVPENMTVFVEMLAYLGYVKVDTATNGEQMLNMVKKVNYDVVFVDILMPVMDGIEAVKKYRETCPMGTKPYIVAVTATNIISEDTESYRKYGMDAFIQKPVKMGDLKLLLDVISEF